MVSKFARFPFCRLAAVLLLAGAANHLLGQMLYVGNNLDDNISAYVIDQDSGILTELLPRVATTGSPSSVAVHPSGKFVYATNSGNPNMGVNFPSISAFSIDPGTGALTPLNSLPLTPGSGPSGAAIDPAGKFLFFANTGPGNVAVYAIDAAGALSPVPGSPFTTSPGSNKVVVHPSGKFAYVTAPATAQIVGFSIAANGALTPLTGSPFAARNNLFWMTTDRAGKFLFVVERQDNAVLVYAVDATTGALTQAGAPVPSGLGVSGVAVDPAGKYLYVTNTGSNSVTVFSIGATGAITQIPRGTFPAIQGAFDAILDPTGKFLYVPGMPASALGGYAIDAGSGALTQLPGFTPAGSQPQRGASILLSPPVIPPIIATSAVNYFSNAPVGMPNAGIAQGSRIAFSGKNIGPAVGVQADNSLPRTELGGASMQIQSGDVTTSALMAFASNGFVTAVVPSTTPLGDATVTVTYKGRTTTPLPITIVPTAFGIRTRNGDGSGPARATNATPDTNLDTDTSTLPVNTLSQSAKPGQFVLIQGTGLGPINVDETQPILQLVDLPATVMVGNKSATVKLKARVTGGNDYILFQLPDDVPQGCYVPVAVMAGGVTSNVASLSIAASGGSCSDATGFTAADLDAAQKSDQIRVGTILLGHINFSLGDVDQPNDFVNGIFGRYDFSTLLQSFAQGNTGEGIRGAFPTPPLGSCSVTPGAPSRPGHAFDTPGDPTFFPGLNPGQVLTMNGPQGTVSLRPPDFTVDFDNNAITPGDYSVDNGAGSPLVGPFKAVLNLPPMVNWTNPSPLGNLDRTQDLTVTWTGGNSDKEFVMVVGISNNQQAIAAFMCTERASAGKFTIPAWVLSSLPATAVIADSGGLTLPAGLLGIGTAPFSNVGRFTATGLDVGLMTYEQATINVVTWQ